MALEPVRNNILFVFEDEFRNNSFDKVSEGGIQYRAQHDTISDARWGSVIAVGPDTRDIVKGDRILIEALMWTEGFKHDGIDIWQTNDEKVMALG